MTKKKKSTESIVKDIKRKNRRKFSAEEKIRIVLEGLKGEESVSGICRHEASPLRFTIVGARIFSKPGRNA